MAYKNSSPIRIDKNGIKTGEENNKGYFICTEHYRHKDVCNVFNKIMETELNEIVLKTVSNRLKELHLDKYSKEIEDLNNKQNSNFTELKRVKKEIDKEECNFKTLYLKKVEKVISEEEFMIQYEQYKLKVSNLTDRLNVLENIIQTLEIGTNSIESAIFKFQNCENFDNTILKKLIIKIEIEKNHNIEISLKV